jgi:hypothetical protein
VGHEALYEGPPGTGSLALLVRENGAWRRGAIDAELGCCRYLDVAQDSKGRALIVFTSASIHGLRAFQETP